jgi:hypothetical protein
MEEPNSEGLRLGGGFMTHHCKFGTTGQCPLLRMDRDAFGPAPHCMKGAPAYEARVTTTYPANCSGAPDFTLRVPTSAGTPVASAANSEIKNDVKRTTKPRTKKVEKTSP